MSPALAPSATPPLPEAPPPLASLTPRAWQIVCAARDLLESGGPELLSMHQVAASLGIRAPSLYKHVHSKDELETLLIALGLWEHGEVMLHAIEHADDMLWELCMAHRTFVHAHPYLYRLMSSRPVAEDPISQAANEHSATPLRISVDYDITSARHIWAFAHGLAMLEMSRRAPVEWDFKELWRTGLDKLYPR